MRGVGKTGDVMNSTTATSSHLKITSALFYAVCSFLITVVNKNVLTTYKYLHRLKFCVLRPKP